MMEIRKAQEKDIERISDLLKQVLKIHADIRPDIFIDGTVKYTKEEIKEIINDITKPLYVALVDDEVAGYAFCQILKQPYKNNMHDFISLFVDDLCVDYQYRNQGIGKELFSFLKKEAKRLNAYEIELNVWKGNDAIEFYEKMGMKEKERRLEYIIK